MIKGVFEVFQHASSQPTDEDKAKFLKQYDTFALRTVLQGCYLPAIKFLLPEGDPPYQQNDPVSVETRFHALAKKMDLFVEGGRPVATQSKREMLFIELLESVHPEDAKIILRMKDKKDPWPGITHNVAYLAYPEFIPPPEEQPPVSVSPGIEEVVEKPAAKKKPARKKKVVDGGE